MNDTKPRKLFRSTVTLGAALPLVGALALLGCDGTKDETKKADPVAQGQPAGGGEPAAPAARPATPDEKSPGQPSAPGAGEPGATPPGGPPPGGTLPPPPPGGAPPGGAAPGGAAPGGAPPGGAPPDTAPGDDAATPVTPKQIDSFVGALAEIRGVQDEYSPKISEADSTETARALQQQAATKIEKRLTEEGLSVDEYERIASRIKADPALQAQVEAKIKSRND